MEEVMVMLRDAVLCVGCNMISDARGDSCPSCAATGSLLSLARVLNPSPELGAITFVLAQDEAGRVAG